MLRRTLLSLGIVLMVSACAAGPAGLYDPPLVQQAVAQSDNLIVPGERVGPFQLGVYMDEVIQKFGQPLARLKVGNLDASIGVAARFDYGNIVLFFKGTVPRVDSIWVYGGSYRTARGIQVGSSTFDVARAYGSSCLENLACPKIGIGFWHDADNRVAKITVDRAR